MSTRGHSHLRRPLALLTGGRLVANGAFRYLYPFLPVVARGLGVETGRAGLLVSGLALGGLVAPVVRRALTGGHEDPRRLALGGLSLMTAGVTVAALAPGFIPALLGFAILGLGKPAYDAASVAHVAEHTAYAVRARYTSMMELTWAGALLVIAPVAGWLISATSWRIPLLGLAVLLAATAVALPGVIDAATSPRSDPPPLRGSYDATALLLLGGAALYFVGQEVVFVTFGVWLEQDFGATVTGLGGFAAAVGGAELVGSAAVLLYADRLGKLPSTIGGLLVSATCFTFLPAADSVAVAVALMAGGLLGFEVAIVATIPVASEIWPEGRSRFVTLFYAVGSGGRVVGAAAGPALFTAVGMTANVTVAVVCMLISAATFAVLARRRDARTG